MNLKHSNHCLSAQPKSRLRLRQPGRKSALALRIHLLGGASDPSFVAPASSNYALFQIPFGSPIAVRGPSLQPPARLLGELSAFLWNSISKLYHFHLISRFQPATHTGCFVRPHPFRSCHTPHHPLHPRPGWRSSRRPTPLGKSRGTCQSYAIMDFFVVRPAFP